MKAVVLLSAGLDSAVNLAGAVSEGEVAVAVTFDYGQRAAFEEVDRSREMSARYGTRHIVVELPFLKIGNNALTGGSGLPSLTPADLDDPEVMRKTAAAVWVPNRNGVFVNAGAAIAEETGASRVVAGFNAEEAASFPDNGKAFLEAANRSLEFSTAGKVSLFSYTLDMNKAAIVALGRDLDAPLDLVWACYDSGPLMCGVCESCRRFKRAVRQAGAEELLEGRFEVED